MRSRFDSQLEKLNNELIEMGGLVECSIENAVTALLHKDKEKASQAIKFDSEVDQKEKEIEHLCLKLLLQQQPVASDLRLISSALKMITDMERIGDQATDISEISLSLVETDYIKHLDYIPRMGKETIEMVTLSIDAFVNRDLSLAQKVIQQDDVVDELFHQIKNDLIGLIRDDIKNSQQAIDFLMIAKYLERIGDHATNIAEWVIFSITGKHQEDNEY